jgi:cyclopropane-fatty-acyl-phospholipid synthase
MESLQNPKGRTSAVRRSDLAGQNDRHLGIENDRHLGIALLETLWGDLRARDFAVRFWDGTTWDVEAECPCRFTLFLKSPEALSKLLIAPSDLALGEAYVFQDIDIEGDVESALDLADEIMHRRGGLGLMGATRIWFLLRRLSRSHREPSSVPTLGRFRPAGAMVAEPIHRSNGHNGPHGSNGFTGSNGTDLKTTTKRWRSSKAIRDHRPEADRAAIAYHYDLSNEFYKLWLDQRMVYSCAYFGAPDEDLDTAQERKLDYVCRKLRLQSGERFLDLGCGWGGLVMHAASHYGVDAFGITLSREQAELATQRIRELGLSERCRVEHRDYRELGKASEGAGLEACVGPAYDKVACVGMFEHVGEANLQSCLKQTFDLVKPGGVFLFHGITRNHHYPVPEPSFVTRYVFPNGELVPISTVLWAAERVGFEVRDAESLREHYMLTLRHWVDRLEANRDEAIRLTSPETFRVWKLFMAGSAQRFRVGQLNLHQALLAKPDERGCSGVPLMRADWYSPLRQSNRSSLAT